MKISAILGFKNIAILGYGKEGAAIFDFLKSIKFSGKITILDQKDNKDAFSDLGDYDLIIKSPGISRYLNPGIQKEFEKGKITSGTEIFLSNCNGKTIGITGTKGKSTTSSLLYFMLKNEFGDIVKLIGNIGEPAISYLKDNNENNIYVIELSSYQIEDLGKGYLLDYGILVSIFPDHLDYHGGFENYKKAKMNIFNISKTVITSDDVVNDKLGATNFNFSNFKLKGQHNIDNCKLAIEIVKRFGASDSNIQKVINEFLPLNHRLKEFEFKNRLWVDDAISTTPESTLALIKVYEKNLQGIILGGFDRGYDFKELIKYLSGLKKLKSIALLPDNDLKILNLIKDYFTTLPKIIQSKDMFEIVKFLYNNTEQNGIIMLSTASPSYNLYKNFEAQGDDFVKNIKLIG